MTRSPLLLVIAALALVLAAGALVLQFALPSKGGVSQSDYDALKAQVASIKTTGAGLKVAYVNVESAAKVFTSAVSDLSQRVTAKQQELAALNSARAAGTVKEDAYQKQLTVLTAEGYNASVTAYAAVIDRMIGSAKFADIKTDLQNLRLQVEGVLKESSDLEIAVKAGASSSADIQSRLAKVQQANSQVESLVNQVYAMKVQQAMKTVAIARGYDLVLIQRNVVGYGSPTAIADLTEFVAAELVGYLEAK